MKKIVLIAMMIAGFWLLNAQTLLHRFEFDGDLTDEIGGSDLIPVHAATSSFADGAWNWTATSHPGGGLLLRANLINPEEYSLRVVFKFNNFYYTWTKILSFQGYIEGTHYFSSDHGLYFYYNQLEFYPYITNPNIVFNPNVWYDMVFTRNANGLIRFYVTPLGQPQQLVLEFEDPDYQAVPSINNDFNCWGLFYDDTHTTSEWTSGGSVSLVEVWGQAYAFDAVQNPQITHVGNQISLNWDPFPGALSYNLYSSDDPENGTWELLGNALGTSTSFTTDAQKRFYRVHAVLE